MNWIKNWYIRQSLVIKYFIFLSFITLILFVMLFWNSLREAEKLFQQQVVTESQHLISHTNEYLNAYLFNIQQLLLLLSLNADLFAEEDDDEIIKVLQEYGELNRSLVKTIYFIRDDGKVYSNQQVKYDIVGNEHIKRIYDQTMHHGDPFLWSETYYTPLSGNTIAFTHSIKNEENQVSGIAMVEIDLEILHNKLSTLFENQNQSFVVLSAENQVITTGTPNDMLPFKGDTYPPVLEPNFTVKLNELPNGISNIENNKESLVTVKSNTNQIGWNVITLIEREAFYANLHTLQNNFRNAGVIWMVILIISTYMISQYFTKPIRAIVSDMDNITDLNSLPGIKMHRNDELGQLITSYNAMLRRMQTLFEEVKDLEKKKKDYQFSALQNQINPHFLYNTLSCIGSLAKQQRNTEIRNTIRSLAKLLSYSFHDPSELVTLKEELNALENYAQIQNIRYGDIFKLELDIDDSALYCKILKLSLQPFLENSIFHGIVPKGGYGTIKITAKNKGDELKIYVSDDGIGMEPEVKRELLKEKKTPNSAQGLNSIGVVNTSERIKLYFGEKYQIKVKSKKEVGTIVKIKIPVVY